MSELGAVRDDTARLKIIDAIRESGGSVTVGDIVAKSGVPPSEAERQLGDLVKEYESDLDVDEDGNLLYRFAPSMSAREDIVEADRKRRRKQALKQAFITFFKIWTVAMVVILFIMMVILLIAFLVAVASQNSNNSSRRRRGGGFNIFFGPGGGYMPIFWGTGGYYRRRRNRRRWVSDVDERLGRGEDPYRMDTRPNPAEEKPGIVDRTWYFLFGADSIQRSPLEVEKELLTYIRAKKGLITNADIMALLGVTYAEADKVGTRLVATYEGELDITEDGIAIYRFPDLMLSGAADEVKEQAPTLGYLWEHRARLVALAKNPTLAIPAMAAAVLVLSILAFTTFLPTLGWTGSWSIFWFVIFPAVFAVSFFAVALRRKIKESREGANFERDNIRISIYRQLFARRRPVRIPGDEAAIAEAGLGSWSAQELAAHTPDIAEEIRGREERGPGGRVILHADRIFAELKAVERLRARASSVRPVGRTVFSSEVADGASAGALPGTGQSVEGGGADGDDALSRAIGELEQEEKS